MKLMIKMMIPLFLLLAVFTGCEVEDDYIFNFKVISNAGGFTGYYIVDGDEIVPFVDAFDTGTGLFEESLENPDSIQIVVNADDDPAQTTSIQVFIYEDKKQVKSEIKYKDVDVALGIDMYYEFGSSGTTESK